MECNKEEAIRAKEIAEKKMQMKDFVGAKKIALKAQQLFSELDNISQMLTVCEVHCCSGARVNGEMDWYGILQVEQTADEPSIKKQYRRLALLLHPDKNKFAGAEAAFKLIGEAHMTLSDRTKRSIFDMKRRANITTVVPRQPAQNPNMSSFARRQPGVQNSYTSTFWTMCTNCCMKFQYFRNLLNKSIRCHRCMANYIASELNEQPVRHPTSANLQNHNQNFKQEVPVQASHVGNSSYRTGFQGNVAGGSSSGINMARGYGGSTNKQKDDVIAGGVGSEAKPAKVKRSTVNAPRKKSRKMVSESSDSDSSTDGEDEVVEDGLHGEEQNAGTSSGRYPRRSCRMKQNFTYKERGIEDDDDFVSPPKSLRKSRGSHSANHGKPGVASGIPSNANDGHRKHISGESLPNGGESVQKCTVHGAAQGQGVKEEVKAGTWANVNPATNSGSKTSPDIRSFSFPDPEFYDFEQERDPSKFAADQIWAIYDDLDAMPRYYARIREVFSPFRLRFTWLEYDPLTGPEDVWKLEKLPAACGNYRVGKSAFTKDLQMFSHQIYWDKGKNRNTYGIYPRKGETWALFKGWDAGWSSDANSHRLYKYEVVEILSDLSDDSDFQVVHLLRVQGFVSLFVRSTTPNGKFQILSAEVLRFSHRVPSYRMSEGEREGVPEGSFELDTASLPSNFGETFPSVSLNTASVKTQKLDPEHSDLHHGSTSGEFPGAVDMGSMKLNEENDMKKTGCKGPSPEGVNWVPGNEKINVAAECPASPSMPPPSPTSSEYLETEFHDFYEDRLIEKFECGQIWALYSDIDQQPKFYAKIKKVDYENVVVSASWVELFPRGKNEEEWKKKDLPAACGRFKVDRKMEMFETTEIFSHLVQAEPIRIRRDEYDIYPRSSEVWALYKNWGMGWTCLDLEKCECYVVEILEVADSVVKVQVLTKVADYNVVFMPEIIGGVAHKMELSLHENLRFSHQIPAFRLTDEAGGALQGYLELDPLSVPPSCI